MTGRCPDGSTSPKSSAAMAAPSCSPGYQFSSTAATLSSHGMSTGPPVSSTTTVRGLAAATAVDEGVLVAGQLQCGLVERLGGVVPDEDHGDPGLAGDLDGPGDVVTDERPAQGQRTRHECRFAGRGEIVHRLPREIEVVRVPGDQGHGLRPDAAGVAERVGDRRLPVEREAGSARSLEREGVEAGPGRYERAGPPGGHVRPARRKDDRGPQSGGRGPPRRRLRDEGEQFPTLDRRGLVDAPGQEGSGRRR